MCGCVRGRETGVWVCEEWCVCVCSGGEKGVWVWVSEEWGVGEEWYMWGRREGGGEGGGEGRGEGGR